MRNIKTTYEEDIQELRIEFARLNKKDPEAVRKWFESKPHLTANDHCQVANRSLNYIRRLRRFAGIKASLPPVLPKSKAKRATNTISVPENWRNDQDWLRRVSSHSVSQIAQACGVSRIIIYRKFKKYGIKSKYSIKSKNKCCTKAWCYRHYVELNWSQEKCAKAAGICQQAFSNWLNRFNIAVRTVEEHWKHKHVQLWTRKLIQDLEKQSVVRRVYLYQDRIHVRFMNFFWETYYPFKIDKVPIFSYAITKRDARLSRIPKVIPQYETDFEELYDEDGIIKTAHIMIDRAKFQKSSLMERRLAVHEFCRQITRREWIWPEHPEYVLQEEWEKLKNCDHNKYVKNNIFTIYGAPTLGRKLCEHFFDVSDYSPAFKSPRTVMKVLNILASRKDTPFDFHNFLRLFSAGYSKTFRRNYPRFRFTDPGAYCCIFNKLNIRGKILDISPDFGNKAIASAIAGLEYYVIPDERFKKAIDKGLADLTGLKYHKWNKETVDVIVYDNDWNIPDIRLINNYMGYAKRMMIFVPREFKDELYSKLKPTSIIKIKTTWLREPNYIFIW
jgi:hypothetical protein